MKRRVLWISFASVRKSYAKSKQNSRLWVDGVGPNVGKYSHPLRLYFPPTEIRMHVWAVARCTLHTIRILFRIKVLKFKTGSGRDSVRRYFCLFSALLELFLAVSAAVCLSHCLPRDAFCGATMAEHVGRTGTDSKPEQIKLGDSSQTTVAEFQHRCAPQRQPANGASTGALPKWEHNDVFPFFQSVLPWNSCTEALKLGTASFASHIKNISATMQRNCGRCIWEGKEKRQTRIGTHVWHNKSKMDAGVPGGTRTAEKFKRCIGLAHIQQTAHCAHQQRKGERACRRKQKKSKRTAVPVANEKKWHKFYYFLSLLFIYYSADWCCSSAFTSGIRCCNGMDTPCARNTWDTMHEDIESGA